MKTSPLFLVLIALLAMGFVFSPAARAQDGRVRAVQVHATTQVSPPQITLHWETSPYTVNYFNIFRRAPGSSTWVYLGNDPAPTATSFTDTTAQVGIRYEYKVYRAYDTAVSTAHARGYTIAGIDAPLLDQRGTVILVIDSTKQSALASEIALFQRNLAGDGWTVLTETAAPTDTPASVRTKLQTRYNAAPTNVKAAILLGRIPVPYSGDINPDGHSEHKGAWPADTYYADLTGTWPDTTVNTTAAASSRNHNIPGDGKFDPSNLPSDAEIAIGRIDMANLSGFSAGANETELLRNYLRKNHEFRHRLNAFADIPRRGLIRDGFGFLSSEAPASVGWRGFTPLFGPANVGTTSNLLTTLETNKYLWAYGNGAGTYSSAANIGTSTDFKTRDSLAVFNMMFGSYFGDWDSPTDNFLRAPLAGTPGSLTLVNTWGNRPDWNVHGMSLGETIGDAYLRTINSPSDWSPNWNVGYFTYYTSQPRMVHIALMGDPSLRLHPVAPPALAAAPVRTPGATTDSIQLSWAVPSPPEPDLIGYHVYRSANPLGPFTRLTSTPTTNLTYTDTSAPKTDLFYQVRAVVLTSSGSGTYHNAGQALFLTVAVSTPAAPASVSAAPASAFSIGLTWTPDALAASHRLERSPSGLTGTWTLVTASLAADATSFTDTGLNAETTYFYRIRSTNAAGDSAWSATVSATTFPDAALSVIVPSTAVAETSGSFTATVARAGTTGSQVVVLSSNDARFTVPASVTIAAGQTSASFTVTVNDDTLLNPSATAVITAFFADALIGESFTGAASTETTGQNTGWGWNGAWYHANASSLLVEPSLTYTKNGTISAPGTRAARLVDIGAGGETRRNFPAKLGTGSVWVSTLLSRNSTNWGTQLIVRQNTSGGDWARVRYASNVLHWELEAGTGNKVQLLNSNPTPSTLFVVMQFDFDARKVRAWLSPDVSGTSPANALGSGEVTMQPTLDGISRLDFGGSSNLDGFDEIRVASTFAKLHAGTTVTRNVTVSDNEDVAIPGPGVIEFTAPVFSTTEPVYTGTTQSETKTVTVTARRTGGNEGVVSVDYAAFAVESLSFAGENYNAGTTGSVSREYYNSRPHVADGTGTLSWADRDMAEKTITFTINADTIYTTATATNAANNLVEGTESLELLLARPKGGATLGTNARARFDILDAQAPAGAQGVIQLARPRFSAFENAGSMPVVLSRTQGSTGAVSATLTTSSSLPAGYGGFTNPITAAVAVADYTTVSQVVTWADGDTADKTVNIPLIDNTAVQSATNSRGVRGIRLQVSAPAGGALTSVNEALGLILDDESETFDVWVENLYGKNMSIRLPRNTPTVRGLIHFMPGTGGDWRFQVNSASHQAVADQWGFAISGQLANAFAANSPFGVAQFHNQLDALALFTGRPELRNVPIIFTGISAGGYACTNSHGSVPDQVLGFVAHKGGAYDFKGISDFDTTPPIHESNLFTPGLIIAGGNDSTVEAESLYTPVLSYRLNLAPGSQITTAIDWNIGHSDTGGQGWAMAYLFMDELIRLRYPAGQVPGDTFGEIVPLNRIQHSNTWLVQQVNAFLTPAPGRPNAALAPRNLQIRPAAGVTDPGTDGMVISERLARAYQAFSSLHATTYQGSMPFQSPLKITSHTTTHAQITGIDLGQSTTVTLDPRGYSNFNRAEFYFDNQLVGTRTAAPWSVTFTPANSGVGLLRVVTSTNGSGETRYAFETLLVRDIPPFPPAAPTGFVATRPTTTSASLTWSTVPFASSIRVQRATAGAAGPWTTIATLAGTATTHSDSTLLAGASYWYRLVATNAYGDSPATAAAVLLVENTELLVNDPFTDTAVGNGTDPFDVLWSTTVSTDGTLGTTTDTTLDPVAPNRVAELVVNTLNKDVYLSFPLPSAVTLALDQGLRVSFKLRHTDAPRTDASATGVSLGHTLNATSAPWNNVNNREYFFITSYGSTTPQGFIRKTGTGGAQLLNTGTQTLASSLASINAGTSVTTVSLEVFRTGESTMRIRYRLNDGTAQEFTDTSDIVTTFNRVFFRFRSRTDAGLPAFRIDDVQVHRLTAALAPAPTPLELWQSEHFTVGQLTNPALESTLWGLTADPDGDGIANLLEYALGGDPAAPEDQALLPSPGTSGDHLTLSFTPQKTAGLSYFVEASSDLSDWSDSSDITANLIEGDPYIFTDLVPVSENPRRFLRLRVTAP